MRNILFGLVALVILGVGGYYVYSAYWPKENSTPEGEQVFCTADAKLCPDGSYVGRVAPSCEFAACPAEDIVSVTQDAKLNETLTQFSVMLTPLQVVEDSRCPIDVQCIQAGTVRLKAKVLSGLGESNPTLELNTPFTTEAEVITLTAVSPAPHSKQNITPEAYVFTFEMRLR